MVDIKFKEKFPSMISLDMLKNDSELANMLVVKRGMRLSIQPVEETDFNHILRTYVK